MDDEYVREALLGRARRRRRTAVGAAGLAVVLVGIGGALADAGLRNDADPVLPGPTTTPPVVSNSVTTSQPGIPTRTDPSTSPRTIPTSGACPKARLPGLPPGSGCASLGRGDFDGDGVADTVVAFAHPLDAKGWAKDWHVRFVPSDPARSPLSMRLPVTQTNLRIAAVVDANRDGRDDVLLDYQDGATTNFLEIAVVSNGRLSRVSSPEGVPFSFALGGSVLQGSGGGCRATNGTPEIVDTGYLERGAVFRGFENVYRWQGIGLVRAGHRIAPIDEADIGQYSQFHCFGVNWPVGVPPIRAR